MKKLQYMLLALPLLLAACGGSGDGGSSDTFVTFTTEVQTRATAAGVISDFTSGDKMMIYGATSNSVAADDLKAYTASYNGSNWQTNPAVTIQPEAKQYYFAAYPADSEATDPSAYPIDVTKQIDYLYSGTGQRATFESPEVKFEMHHAMAVIAFNIQSYKGGKLTQIKIGNDEFPLTGEMRVASGKITTLTNGVLTQSVNASLTTKGWTTNHPSIFVIPYTIGAEGLPVELTIDGKSYTVTLPAMRLNLAYKYVFSLLFTEQGLVLEADKTETINLLDATEGFTEEPYSYLKITHKNGRMVVPTLTGDKLHGLIYWGNEMQQKYAAETEYQYTGSSAPYTLAIDAWNVTNVTFSNIKGVQEIDFSNF